MKKPKCEITLTKEFSLDKKWVNLGAILRYIVINNFAALELDTELDKKDANDEKRYVTIPTKVFAAYVDDDPEQITKLLMSNFTEKRINSMKFGFSTVWCPVKDAKKEFVPFTLSDIYTEKVLKLPGDGKLHYYLKAEFTPVKKYEDLFI